MHLNVEELKELICAGWEIGSHGVTHESLLRLDDADIEWQLKESKKILEELFGPVISYAYPYGDISPYIEDTGEKILRLCVPFNARRSVFEHRCA